MSLIAILRAMEKLHIPFGEEKRIVSDFITSLLMCYYVLMLLSCRRFYDHMYILQSFCISLYVVNH